jgi:alpha-D-ribose 1-methylphosphonate 5-phosphate C-P lyase
MSNVVPAGTDMLLRTMVEQAAFDLVAVAASVNVQFGARYCNLPTVWGMRGGVAATDAVVLSSKIAR